MRAGEIPAARALSPILTLEKDFSARYNEVNGAGNRT